MMHNWVLAFVTFNPPQSFFEQLQLALQNGYPVMVLDNTPTMPEGFALIGKQTGLSLIHKKKNLGLGPGMNALMKEAKANSFEYALYFDQDTLFTTETLRWIDNWISREGAFPEKFSAVGFESMQQNEPEEGHIMPARLLINNGTLFRLKALEQIGYHNTSYFVECVDYRFCLDSAAKGYKLGLVDSCPGIDHQSLQPEDKVRILGRGFSFRVYPHGRSKSFLSGLLGLAWLSLRKGKLRYAWIFFRNILSFLLTQSWFRLLRLVGRKTKIVPPAVQLGIVVYGHKNPFGEEIAKLKKKLSPEHIFIVNNLQGAASEGEIEGDNKQYEFSAYAQFVGLFQNDGPYVIANDTLFRTHWAGGWAGLLKRAVKNVNPNEITVYGDIRRDGNAIPERPDPFLASWIFLLPNRKTLNQFGQALNKLFNEPLPPPSPAYETYLQWWTNPNRRLRGWHGDRSAEGIQRKLHCIRLEHALSKAMPQHGLALRSLGEFAPFRYAMLRIIDRLRTAISRLNQDKR